MNWKIPEDAWLASRLAPPQGPVDMVLDTDAYNEVDDQFALAYCLLSPERVSVQAVYAAPFYCHFPDICINERSVSPADGMKKSYNEIVRLLALMDIDAKDFAFRGSEAFLPDEDTPVSSPAARDLISRVKTRRKTDGPLYVVAIGAITNVASALLMEPSIRDKIVVVWLGGHPGRYPHTAEFNLIQDIAASRVLLDSGVPLVRIPCLGVASHMLVSIPDVTTFLSGANPLCDALVDILRTYTSDSFAWSKEIWDIAAVAYLINPEWVPTMLTHSAKLTGDFTWAPDPRRHLCREAYFANRNDIFRDLFVKLKSSNYINL